MLVRQCDAITDMQHMRPREEGLEREMGLKEERGSEKQEKNQRDIGDGIEMNRRRIGKKEEIVERRKWQKGKDRDVGKSTEMELGKMTNI